MRWDHELHSFSLSQASDTQPIDHLDPTLGGSTQTNVLIPTEDTLRYTFLVRTLTHHSFPVLLLGPTGTGKTSTLSTFLTSGLSKDEWETGQLVLSATATAGQVQQYLGGRVEKQRKGVYGPKVPGRRMIVMVDDMNMPAKEKYGAQPPIELLR